MELTRFREFKDDLTENIVLIDAKKICAIMRGEKDVVIHLLNGETIFLERPTQSEAIQQYDALAIWWKYWAQEGDFKSNNAQKV